jgi:uncharacterized membrane protein
VWALTCGATHLYSFSISGTDFSVFEWMVGSTHQGHFGYSRIYDLNHFGVHSTFLMLALVPFHALFHSPWVLLVAGSTLVWAGLFPLRRLVRWAHGAAHGGLELIAMVAWLGNPWAGKLINSGFRIESLVPVLTLWFLVGWVEARGWLSGLAMVGLWFSKEDTTLFLLAFAVGAALVERPRWRGALVVAVGSLGWLGVYVKLVQPALLGQPPMYTTFWSDFGDTLPRVVVGMLQRPLEVAKRVITSGWWTVLLPALLLPLRSPRAALAMAPVIVLLGAASYDQMHSFATYYPTPLLAFVLFGALEVWRQHPTARALVVASLLAWPLFWGGYARAEPIDWERLRGLEEVKAFISKEPVICVQDVIFPHMGVDDRLHPFGEPGLCIDHPEMTIVLNPELNTWPHEGADFDRWFIDWSRIREVVSFRGGFKVLVAKPLVPAK